MGALGHSPHAPIGTVAILKVSRACLIDARDKPGGERHDNPEAFPEGVAGTVSKAVPPKRHRRLSIEEDSDALSSEVLPFPVSVVCSALSRSSMNTGLGAFFAGASASNLRSVAACLAFNSIDSRAARVFAERTPAIDDCAPVEDNAIDVGERAAEEKSPHAATGSASSLQASRACLIDARDNPGGEPTVFESTLSFLSVGGVVGMVSNDVLPKRHCLPATRGAADFSAVTVLCNAWSDNLLEQVSHGSMVIISPPTPSAIFGLEWLSSVQLWLRT
jgi:hypothetical protein